MMLYGDGPSTDTAIDVEEVTLPPGPDAARTARDVLERCLRSWSWDHRATDAELCVSEVLTVVLEAGYQSIRMAVLRLSDRVYVELRCAGGDCRLSEVLSQGESGRSTSVVDSTSSVWGVRPTGDGDAIWFELR
jgi:anti-sigma regulatory factor (Ser/Thr protein kinase)